MRPQVTINAAMSVDGKIAIEGGRQTRLSSDEDMRRVHELRAEVDAILVGVNTVLTDDPTLTIKREYADGEDPLRVILDTHGRTPPYAKVLQTPPPTLIAVGKNAYISVPGGVSIKRYPVHMGLIRLESLLEDLYMAGIRSLLVEGGGTVIWSFLRGGLFDRLYIFMANVVLGGDGPTLAMGTGSRSLVDAVRLNLDDVRRMEGGLLLTYSPMR